ncbi:MAG: hypothetical protein ACT6Q7_06850 [Blastomonas fulva]|uniref:hypothetical protein n=1 Tax=Blastomonas TaxID=150203 RepID=UPI0012374E07|nr:hypothetical protein [Blastomonas sp. RAC04]
MIKYWRPSLGVLAIVLGLSLRDHAHSLEAQKWVLNNIRRAANPDGPPACAFDCTYRLTGDAQVLGWVSVGLIVAGVLMLMWSSGRQKSTD